MLGCTPEGRHTEQHDVFFTLSTSLKGTIPGIKDFWPEAANKIHIDAWREVTEVQGYQVNVVPKASATEQRNKLFFINLGGYKQGEFDEPHYKLLLVAPSMGEAVKQAKQTAFYQHTGYAGATSHIDDRYGVDVDDAFEVLDILPKSMKEAYSIEILEVKDLEKDQINLGYLQLHKILG